MSMLKKVLSYTLLLLASAVFLWPLLFIAVGSLLPDDRVLQMAGKPWLWIHAGWHAGNYIDVFTRVPFGRYMVNSLLITGMVVVAGLLVNSMAGYALARWHWPGRGVVSAFVIAVMIIPLEAIAVPLFYQVSWLGWRDSYLVQILPFIANAFSVYLFYTFFHELPRELEQAAYVDGAGPWRTYFTIVVPNSKPVFASVAILSFLTQWGAYLWPLMVTHSESVRPLPLAIASFYTLPPLQWGDIFAFGIMMVLPVLIVFVLFQRWFVRGVAAAGIKG